MWMSSAAHISFRRPWISHLRVPSAVSLIRFPSLEDQQGRYLQLPCCICRWWEQFGKNWTMDSLWVNMFVRVRGPLPLSYIAQLRRARVLPTTVRAATVVEKHIIEHYSRSLSLLCVVKIYTMLYAGAQIASISLYRQYVCGIFRYGREFRKNRLNEAIISRGKMTEKHVFVMFSPLVLVCKHTSFTVQHCRGASLCCWK